MQVASIDEDDRSVLKTSMMSNTGLVKKLTLTNLSITFSLPEANEKATKFAK